uniref:Tetratricopeptide repeat domain 37 n=1 Tax=Gouania willdenowi TaxID=441366 RepID=A0A8C5IAR0_GOUWI
MSSKEVKAALKSAREAIKNKEFKEALKHCKTVLKVEKTNYNAWVFIGLAASELDQPDQSQSAYKKAVELEPDQLLAWQGLANLYEKVDQWDFKAELPNMYQKLIELYASSDKTKCYEMVKKLCDIYESDKENSKVSRPYHILYILSFEKAMALMDPVPGDDHKKISANFVECLSKLPQEEVKMKEVCQSVLLLYPNQSYPLEVLCSHYLTTVSCFSQLLELSPNNGLGHLGLGTKALEESRFEDAIKSLTQGLKKTRLSFGWHSLAEAQFKLHRYSDSLYSCSQGSAQARRAEVRMLFFLDLLSCSQGQSIYKISYYHFVFFLLSFLSAVSQSPDCAEYYFLLGQLYWDMGEETRKDRSKAHTHLLKAAKLDPNFGSAFRYLGHYYRVVANDSARAQGCYKKAFQLNNDDDESGAASVDLSMGQGDMDTALAILESVIEKATPGSAKWAWMRRGLYYLKVGENQQAIADLQSALRADPEDWVSWECLGEAYLNRRSFTAALKAFAKAHQLHPSSIYSVYQAAAIKQTLGKFKEAVAEYLLITEHQDYVPALKGLGECQLSLAKSLMEDCRDGGAIDLIQKSINNLFRAVQLRPDLSCLWKLLGDACTTVHIVSPNRAQVQVPALLVGLDPNTEIHMLNQTQILKVGESCYVRALKLMPEVSSLWYDLGLNYYHQASSQLEKAQQVNSVWLYSFFLSLQCLKKAIMMDSGNHSYWNALGVVSTNKGVENFALAQHSFIKSIQAYPDSVVAWTNLGALYLKKDNLELAHEAFKTAQSLEPLYVNCWIGQALIAEGVGSFDTMDLFRHTTELSTHMEGVKGYAYWVCSTLLDKTNRSSELYCYNIVQMNAISAAQVALSKYTERIQSDPCAFIMLGYLNEHLQLKRQAVQAYRSKHEAVRHVYNSTDHSTFACMDVNTGQVDRFGLCFLGLAVDAYNSTSLQELSDLVGLALVYCRAGLFSESSNAYERALAVASSEKEKAYIMTALALLQHRQNNLDSAKTLLFKCSMLKEPISESLLCLCALGLVHSDATLATAALTELLKQGPACGSVVEQQCLLTCALLSLQGNYSAVQREASRAVHRNPGNPSLWAILSRVIPQYYPQKANVSLKTHKPKTRALLYSGVNQLANGRHCGEDKHKNAIKTMQRAVLLCPDDAATWAGLMAACHTENTACYLSGLAPNRQGLNQSLMSVVSEKELERPLAQSLEGWVLQQAVSGLTLEGRVEQAEALCTQVLNVSPEHPAVMLSLRQVQCQRLLIASAVLPDAVLEQLNSVVMINSSNVGAWHWLAEVYRSQGLLLQAVMAYKQSLQFASQLGMQSCQVASLLRLALLALRPCMVGLPGNNWTDLVLEATTEVLKLGSSPVALLFQALLHYLTKMTARETRRMLERLVYVSSHDYPETVVQVASWYLLRHLHTKNDEELINVLLQHAKKNGNQRLLEFHLLLSASSA